MNITPRQAAIIAELLKTCKPVQTGELADRLGLGLRTVQRELPDIEKEVKKCGATLERSRTKGVRIVGDANVLHTMRESIRSESAMDASDKEARRRMLLLALLKERQPRKLYFYADNLGVSEATVASDIEALLPWFEKNRLTVIRKKGYGVFLNGSESDYREAMRRFIHENGGEELTKSAKLSESSISEALLEEASGGIYQLLDTRIMRRVDEVLSAMEEPHLQRLTENAYAGLIIHIAIAIERIRQGGRLDLPKEKVENLMAMEDYDLAKRILGEMEEEFEITFPEEEVAYVLLHIRGAKVAFSRTQSGDMDNEKLLSLIDKMINAYDPALAILLKQDDRFVQGLMIHLEPVLVRIKSKMNIYNPLLNEIKDEYADVFEKCKKAAGVITVETGLMVSDEEIGFLAMHFGAAEDRAHSLKKTTRKVRIGVVCASGFGVAQLMSARLAVFLKDKAKLAAYGKEELGAKVIAETDFFVSTMNLDDKGVDYLLVSPLISGEDQKKIEHKAADYAHTRRMDRREDFMDRMRRLAVVSGDIVCLTEDYCRYEVEPTLTFAELIHNLAIRVTGSLAGADMVCDEILNREKLNTQIFPELGIALLHTRTKATKKPVFVSCIPREAECFTDPYFKKTKAVVFMLSPNDETKEDHTRVLGAVSAAFIGNEEFLYSVINGEEEKSRKLLEEIFEEGFDEMVGIIL